MQKHKFTLAPGAGQTISADATMIRVYSIVAAPTLLTSPSLKVTNDQGHDFELIGKAKMRLDRAAKRWYITNTTTSTLDVALLLGQGDYDDSEVTATVSITDATTAVVAGQCFQGSIGQGYVAGGLAFDLAFSLRNEGTKQVFVDSLELAFVDVSAIFEVWAVNGGPPGAAQAGYTYNKSATGAAATSKLYVLHQQATIVPGGTKLFQFEPGQDESRLAGHGPSQVIKAEKPILLPPSWALVLTSSTSQVPNGGRSFARWAWREL